MWRRWESAQDTLAPSPSAGRALSIDVERAREVVGRLEAAADEIRRQAESMLAIQVSPPGSDVVSRNAAAQCDNMIFAARRFLESWHGNVVYAAQAIQQQTEDYVRIDEQNLRRA